MKVSEVGGRRGAGTCEHRTEYSYSVLRIEKLNLCEMSWAVSTEGYFVTTVRPAASGR